MPLAQNESKTRALGLRKSEIAFTINRESSKMADSKVREQKQVRENRDRQLWGVCENKIAREHREGYDFASAAMLRERDDAFRST